MAERDPDVPEYSDQSCSWVSTWKWCNMRWKIGANTKPVAMISKRPEKIAYDPAKIFPAVVFSSPIGPMPARIIAALTYESASDIPVVAPERPDTVTSFRELR